MAKGTATLDFGVFPGKSDASVAVTGQAGIVSGSLVEAWLRPEATADHTADEHLVETIKITAGNIIAGTGFTIYGMNTSQLNEPLESLRGQGAQTDQPINQRPQVGGKGTRIWGQWSVAWVWS
jgi:hypothetical protein